MTVRRQARGEQRMAAILDAAAVVFARAGYEAATTNAIAAEAGISPGSLYQFFAGKDAIALALAERFTNAMRAAHQQAFEDVDISALSLPALLDRVVDPIVAFNLANPGFKALFARPDMPTGLAEAARPIQNALFGRVKAIVADRAPSLSEPDRDRTARVLIQVFQAMVPLITAAPEKERGPLTTELKHVLTRYLDPLTGDRV